MDRGEFWQIGCWSSKKWMMIFEKKVTVWNALSSHVVTGLYFFENDKVQTERVNKCEFHAHDNRLVLTPNQEYYCGVHVI